MNIRNELALTLQITRSMPRTGKDGKEYGTFLDAKGWGLKLSLMVPTTIAPPTALPEGAWIEIGGSLEDATNPGATPGQLSVKVATVTILDVPNGRTTPAAAPRTK